MKRKDTRTFKILEILKQRERTASQLVLEMGYYILPEIALRRRTSFINCKKYLYHKLNGERIRRGGERKVSLEHKIFLGRKRFIHESLWGLLERNKITKEAVNGEFHYKVKERRAEP